MWLKPFLIGIMLCWHFVLPAQKSQVEIAGGVEFGWWLHQLGSSNGDDFNDLGVSKTHHSPIVFLNASWLWRIKKLHLGPTLCAGQLREDEMKGPADSRGNRQRIPIAKNGGNVPLLRYGLQAEYQLLRRGNYSFVPALRYGAVQWSTLHPDRDRFGYHQFHEIILQHLWHRKKTDWLLRMSYTTQQIFLKEKNNPNESHHLYFWGTSLGVRF